MLKRITKPEQVVLLKELKQDLHIDYDDRDEKLERCIDKAEAYIDGYRGILGRAMLSQQWSKTFPAFSTGRMKLDLGPLISVDSITYYDELNAQQTLASTVYEAHDGQPCPYFKLAYNQTWPATYTRDDAITVTFTCGNANRYDVDENVKAAICLLAGYFFENTEAAQIDKTHPIAIGVYDILHPSRVLL